MLASGLLALAVWLNRDEVREVLSHRPNGRYYALAFGLYLLGVLLAYTRWFLLVRAVGIPFRPIDALRLGLIGTLFNLVIPGAVGGDFVKAAALCKERPGWKTQAIASIVIDRLLGLMGLFLLAAAAGAWSWGTLDRGIRNVVLVAWIALGVTAILLVLAFSIHPDGPITRRLGRRKRPSRLIAELHLTGEAYRRHFGVVVLGVILAAITHSGNVLAFSAISHALFPETALPSLAEHFMIVPIVLFSTAIPLPFGALGATEQISASLFRLTSYGGGAVAMMGFRTLQYLGASIGAVVYAVNRQQVRDLTRTARRLAAEPIEP
ncbi:MAG: lysylphosphatidylglycerol synthase transmembrane domain-containing protein [Isosphaeraceae bacterium]